jgi:hypothetical protein
LLAEHENTEMLKLLRLLCQIHGILAAAPSNRPATLLEEAIHADEVVRQIIASDDPKRTDATEPR